MNSAPQSPLNNEASVLDIGMPLALAPAIKSPAIAPAQMRAARSLLDWSRAALAKESGVSPETIKNIEHGAFLPKEETLKALVETLARHGVELVRFESVVRLPSDNGQTANMISISYEGAVLVTASIKKIQEEAHD
jgi:transcriptional regulator with XRE-family HTH domain